MSTISPNMNLILSTVAVDSGLLWEQNLNASLTLIDQHNHTPGNGVQITPSGLNINSNLNFQNQQATGLQSSTYLAQTSLSTLLSVYVSGVDLYYNDGSGNVVRLTSGGAVNATSSGITSGTATASFVSSVLVVNAASSTPANIEVGSVLLGNNSAGSKFLTLSPPAAMASNFTLTLPLAPAAQNFLSIDSSGNIASFTPVSGGITGTMIASTTISSSNIVANTITASQIANNTITATQIANSTLTGTQITSNVSLAGKNVLAGSNNVVVSNANPTTNGLAIARGEMNVFGTQVGEGFTYTYTATGLYTVTYAPAFLSGDVPVVCVSPIGFGGNTQLVAIVTSPTNTGCVVNIYNNGTAAATSCFIIVIGQRA